MSGLQKYHDFKADKATIENAELNKRRFEMEQAAAQDAASFQRWAIETINWQTTVIQDMDRRITKLENPSGD